MAVYFRLHSTESGEPIVYTFPIVFKANYPHSEKKLIEHENVRGKGSIIVDGGDSAWDITLTGVLIADDYDALIVLVDAMESAVTLNTSFVLKINKTSNTYYSYNVKRILPIEWQEDNLRTNYLEYKVTMRVSSW